MSETVMLEVEIAAGPETVFGFFTDPAAFDAWMGGAIGSASVDPRPGGELRVEFPGGHIARGEVVAVEPPRRFAFTWGMEGSETMPAGASTVEILLEERVGATLVTLRHVDVPEADVEGTRGGFRLYLSRLAAESARAEHAGAVAPAVEAWFRGWNADDPAEREAAFAACLAEDGEFRHDWAALRGRDDLARHVEASRMVMQGIRLEPSGEPGLCHRWVRFGWKAVREGETISTGENVGSLGPDGRFDLVVGFTDAPPA